MNDALARVLIDEIRALRADLAARPGIAQAQPPAPLGKTIWESGGTRIFNAAEVVAHSKLPDAIDLRSAIAGMSPRQLGKALSRIEGADVDGYVVHRVGDDRDGACWTVASLHTKLT